MTNLIKSTALVAALTLGTAASAYDTFGTQMIVDDNDSITVDLVRASEAGVLAVYDYSKGEFGELLGTADLNAGANTDVNVPLELNNAQTVAAVIYSGEITSPEMGAGWMEFDVAEEDS